MRAPRRHRRDRVARRLRRGDRQRRCRRHDPPRGALLRRGVAQGHRDEPVRRLLGGAGGVRGAAGLRQRAHRADLLGGSRSRATRAGRLRGVKGGDRRDGAHAGRRMGSAWDSLQRGDARHDRHPQGARDARPRAGWRDDPDPARPLRRARGAGRRRRLPALAGGGVHQRNGRQGRRRARPVDAMTRSATRIASTGMTGAATRTVLAGVLSTGLAAVSVAADPANLFASPPARSAYVAVSVATVWTTPQSPRPVDRRALTNPVDIRGWLSDMTPAQQEALTSDNLNQTQALFGERVVVVQEQGHWDEVRVPGQPTPKDSQGYPGWIPKAQLTTDPGYAALQDHAPFALANRGITTWLYRESG